MVGACGRTGSAFDSAAEDRCTADGDGFFATVVLDYEPSIIDFAAADDEAVDPQTSLGPPDARPTPPLGAVSLGEGGTLTLGFSPCFVGTDGTSAPDLVIHEFGYSERTTVALLPTDRTRVLLGSVLGVDGYVVIEGPPDSVDFDIDATLSEIPPDAREFAAVRLRDVAEQGENTADTPGADIDAVEAMVPVPQR